jgi:hypothetical protein
MAVRVYQAFRYDGRVVGCQIVFGEYLRKILPKLEYSPHFFEIGIPEALRLATLASATAVTSQEKENV